MRKRVIVGVIIICIVLMLIVVSVIDSLDHDYSDEPAESDLIVMLGGGDAGRMEKAAELYKEGYAEHVLITPVIESDELAQSSSLAMEYGIPEDALILETEADSTYTNATITMDIMKERDMHSALIVTSDYHIKRSKFIYDRMNDGSFDFRYIAALDKNGDRWHEADGAFYAWRTEFIKLWWYRFGLYHLSG